MKHPILIAALGLALAQIAPALAQTGGTSLQSLDQAVDDAHVAGLEFVIPIGGASSQRDIGDVPRVGLFMGRANAGDTGRDGRARSGGLGLTIDGQSYARLNGSVHSLEETAFLLGLDDANSGESADAGEKTALILLAIAAGVGVTVYAIDKASEDVAKEVIDCFFNDPNCPGGE